jgi:hypothetical protein
MSRYVAALVYRKRVGSMARKAILAYCAERANDDGTGVWPAKTTVAREVECSKQTVIDVFRQFVSEGLLIEVGKRTTGNGYVVCYDLNIDAIKALDDAISEVETTGPILDRSSQLTPRGQATGPQEVKPVDPNRPLTVLKPSIGREGLFDSLEDGRPKSDGFEDFWKVYPQKSGKEDAQKAWRKAITIAPAETIIAAAVRYAEWLNSGGPGEFRPQVKFPQGWLNGKRWEDPNIAPAPDRRARFQPPSHEEVFR